MQSKAGLFAVALIAGSALSAMAMPANADQIGADQNGNPQAGTPQIIQLASCMAGDKINGSTAEQTKKKIEAAGYTHVRDLQKGCDNFWHGVAVNKDGQETNVLVTPEGEVKLDGN